MDSNGSRGAFCFQAKLDGFANAPGYFIEGTGLRVAARELRNGGDVIAVLFPLDHYVNLARRRFAHTDWVLLPWGRDQRPRKFVSNRGRRYDSKPSTHS